MSAMRCGIVVVSVCGALSVPATAVYGQTYTEPIARAAAPVGFTAPPGDPSRGFVIERSSGRIRVIDLTTNTILPEPLLQITDLATTHAEQGLLGLTFDPDFANNGYFYVNYTATNKEGGASPPLWHENTHVERYTMMGDPLTSNIADPDSMHTILRIVQPQPQHNAGWMAFGPNDGYLYIATGDGGFCIPSQDPTCGIDDGPGHTENIGNSQDVNNLLGAMLRIDVHGDDFPEDTIRNYAVPETNPFVGEEGADEIWAYGLRNPWRNSFDRETGDLWIADVGGARREEINFQRADWPGGANYGWRLREGDIATPVVGGQEPADHVPPVYVYRRIGTPDIDPDLTGNAVIGGYVYRGSVDEFVGHYFFADFVSRNIWKLDPDAIDIPSSVTNVNDSLPPSAGSLPQSASFGEDANGELYVVGFGSGSNIYRLATTSRRAVWNGDDATAGVPGDGSGWGDTNNWSRDGVADTPFISKDTVVFSPGSSQPFIDLEGERTVAAVEFHAPFTLQNDTLQVLSGNVTVAPGVVATIESDLAAESVHHAIRKLGAGALLVDGSAGQAVVRDGVLGGSGTFDHLSVRSGGTVAPGTSIGILNVENSYNMEQGAALAIEIGGTIAGSQFDLLAVAGLATLAGDLNVELINGFTPSQGDRFEILTASGGINGVFDNVNLPSLAGELAWNVLYQEDNVSLAVALPGDYNQDGIVDAADYAVWRDALGQSVEAGTSADGDFDGEVTTADYHIWKAGFGGTAAFDASGSDVASELAVPEPSTLALLVISASLGILPHRRLRNSRVR